MTFTGLNITSKLNSYLDLNKSGDLLDYSPPEIAIDNFTLQWQMTRVERLGLLHLLNIFKPKFALEIGTDKGGSLQAIMKHAQKAISIDINSENQTLLESLPEFKNVSFLTGNSSELLPELIQAININSRLDLNFILIDGDHSTIGCQRDIESILEIIPKSITCIVMHDSFMPSCRKAMIDIDWECYGHVHYVELDYIHGAFISNNDGNGFKMVGGLAVALLKPQKRFGDLKIFQSHTDLFQKLNSIIS